MRNVILISLQAVTRRARNASAIRIAKVAAANDAMTTPMADADRPICVP